MLKKILKIENLGKFTSFRNPPGDLEFRQTTLLFGENGQGKTTLAAVLRSLVSNDPAPIQGRRIESTNPVVEIRMETETVRYTNNCWSNTVSNIEIFDSTFVNDNLYSGHVVDHDHLKNLYQFVLGQSGVQLVKRIEDLDSAIKRKNDEIKSKGAEIEVIIKWEGKVPEFISLQPINDIDLLIKKAKDDVNALDEAEKINKRATLEKLKWEEFSESQLREILRRRLEDLSASAESSVKAHIASCMDSNGESWLQNGMEYISENNCPFCGQDLSASTLLSAYQGFFGKAYASLKEEISQIQEGIQEYFSQAKMLGWQKTFEKNQGSIELWKDNISDLQKSRTQFDDLLTDWGKTSAALLSIIEKKKSTLLDQIDESEATAAIEQVRQIQTKIENYNQWVENCLERIEKFKSDLAAGDLRESKKNLARLEATKSRYQVRIQSLCDEYTRLVTEKETLEAEKVAAKNLLDGFTKDTLFPAQIRAINAYLSKFGADLTLAKFSTSLKGGKPSASYGLKINNTAIPLDADPGEPSFKTSLSDGDRNALAFAFFMVRLDNDPDLALKIVVIDDPITSLDLNRRTCTAQEIIRLCGRAKQVIVLSHDEFFLKMIWDKTHTPKALCVRRKGNGNAIEEWDITTATQSDYFKNYAEMVAFVDGNTDNPRSVARCIRPLLEGYLRTRFPGEFKANEWLGNFSDQIANAPTGHRLENLKIHLPEINDIKDYSSKYHHQQNPNADSESINETELLTYVRRTLAFIS